jgi:hypothetical protein
VKQLRTWLATGQHDYPGAPRLLLVHDPHAQGSPTCKAVVMRQALASTRHSPGCVTRAAWQPGSLAAWQPGQ